MRLDSLRLEMSYCLANRRTSKVSIYLAGSDIGNDAKAICPRILLLPFRCLCMDNMAAGLIELMEPTGLTNCIQIVKKDDYFFSTETRKLPPG